MFPIVDNIDQVSDLMGRLSHLFHSQTSHGSDIHDRLMAIKLDVLKRDDVAVLDYTRQFDRVTDPEFTMQVSSQEIQGAYSHVSAEWIAAFKRAKHNIEDYHKRQLPQNWHTKSEDIELGLRYHALDIVGVYVPGGRAAYPSTVLMNVVPAQLAGVEKLVMVTPPRPDGTLSPYVLVAADICDVSTIFKVGGAQAVFALAKGTAQIPKVDKIVGPGNIYVTKAKQMVYGIVDIDKPAGPSEVVVYIKDAKYAAFAASELWAQLEHDPLSFAVAVSEDQTVLEQIQHHASTQLPRLERKGVLSESQSNGILLRTDSEQASIDAIHLVAPEHLVLLFDEYDSVLSKIRHAGSIFCGPYTPVTLGDYYAGPNHVLPTERTARFASPLGVMDFVKYSSFMSYSKSQLENSAEDLKCLTYAEGLDAHYQAVSVRLS